MSKVVKLVQELQDLKKEKAELLKQRSTVDSLIKTVNDKIDKVSKKLLE